VALGRAPMLDLQPFDPLRRVPAGLIATPVR